MQLQTHSELGQVSATGLPLIWEPLCQGHTFSAFSLGPGGRAGQRKTTGVKPVFSNIMQEKKK